MKNKANFREGYDLAMQNAEAHLKAAELIAEKINYGLANSHLILSSEEAVKAYMCYAKFYEPDIQIQNFDGYFKDHKQKHEAIKNMTFFIEFMKQMLMVTMKPLKKLMKEKCDDYTTEEFIAKRKEGVSNVAEWLKTIPNIEHNEQWWNDANANKNKGLYVNVVNDKWQSPSDIKKETYEKSHKIISEVLEFMKILPQIENDPEMQERYQQIKKIQEAKD